MDYSFKAQQQQMELPPLLPILCLQIALMPKVMQFCALTVFCSSLIEF